MSKKRIVMLPLDERPCNYNYPSMMPKTEYELILPPKQIMGNKKIAGDTKKISEWLLDNAQNADAIVLSLDTLIYGGILPSRLHHYKEAELISRTDIIPKIKELNPNVKLYAFGLIMRCPNYSSSDEEPDYYGECGAEIHLYGKYSHLEQLGQLSEKEKQDFERIKSEVKEEYLNDFLNRRKTNLNVLMHNLSYVKNGVIDYFIVPQDDAAVYGFTALDQIIVRDYLKSNVLHKKTAMYPSADDTGLTLLARAVAQLSGVTPKVYVHYSSSKGGNTIPIVEDRMVDETIKHHILSIGGIQVYSLPEADMLLAVNIGSDMLCTNSTLHYAKAYDIERNLAEFVTYIEYALSMDKIVAVGDVAFVNRADTELTALMNAENLLLQIHAYAGWNTSSNTMGTALCQAVLYMIGRDEAGNQNFLLHRYYEDIGFMAFARNFVNDKCLGKMGLSYYALDGKEGMAAQAVKEAINKYMCENYPLLAEKIKDFDVKMPWIRMFETDIKLKI